MDRPRNWYDMDYESQRAWERREQDHAWVLSQSERERERLEDDLRVAEHRAAQRHAAMRADYANVSASMDQLAEELIAVKDILVKMVSLCEQARVDIVPEVADLLARAREACR